MRPVAVSKHSGNNRVGIHVLRRPIGAPSPAVPGHLSIAPWGRLPQASERARRRLPADDGRRPRAAAPAGCRLGRRWLRPFAASRQPDPEPRPWPSVATDRNVASPRGQTHESWRAGFETGPLAENSRFGRRPSASRMALASRREGLRSRHDGSAQDVTDGVGLTVYITAASPASSLSLHHIPSSS